MAVKSLVELQGEQGASPAAAMRPRAKSLTALMAEQAREVATGARDPFLGHMVPYHVDHPNRPAIAGLFVDEGTRDLFNDVVDPTQWARPKGLHFERDDDDKLAAYYTIDLGIPPGLAGFETETITEALLGARLNAKTATQRIGDYWKNGQIQVQRADLALEILMGSDTPETWAELDRLGKAVTGDVRAKFRPWWEKMLSSTAEILPYSIEGLKASPEGMVPGALAGGAAAVAAGQAGPQALLPEEMISVPAAMWAGLRIGGTISAARRIGEIEAGGALLDMLDMGIDRNIARAAAVGVGVLNGGLEMLQIDTLLKTLPGGRKLAAGAVRRTVNKLLKEHTLRNLALRKSVEFAGYLSAETLTELAQDSVNISAEELGKVLHAQLGGEDIDPATIDEIVARYKEIGAKSLQGFAVLGLPGTATGTAVEIGETIVMRGSPALRMMPRPRQTQVRVFDPAEMPPAAGKPSAVVEGEALAAEGLAAARPAPGTTPGQVTAKEATDESAEPVSPVAPAAAPGPSLEATPPLHLEGLSLDEQADAIAAYTAEYAQPLLDRLVGPIVERLGADWKGRGKSAQSLVGKVQRKGVGPTQYDVLSPKDHARGVIIVPDWDRAMPAIEALAAEGVRFEESLDEPLNKFGYRGFAGSIAITDQINGEIQIHTPQSWQLKQETDAIYRRWRDLRQEDIDSLPAEQQRQYLDDVDRSWLAWEGYWDRVGSETWSPLSSYVQGLPSQYAPTVTPLAGRHTPSTSSSSRPSSGERRTMRPSGKRVSGGMPITESITDESGPVKGKTLESALDALPLEALQEKARAIGLTVKGKKAQLAALISEAIRAKVAGKQTRAERRALAETEAAIAGHPIYADAAEAEATFVGKKIDPGITYFVEAKYKGDVEQYTGKPWTKGYNVVLGRKITYDKTQGQAWDDAAKEQGFEWTFDQFMDSLARSVADDRRSESKGLNESALTEALRSGEPELAILAEKRDMLKEGRSIWEINQAVHAVAADAGLDLRDYEHLLIGGDMAAPAGEAHPGSLSFKEFFDRLGRELVERDSPWLKRWTLPEVLEKPREMWRRLQREWQAIEAHQISSELNVGQVAEAGRALTAEQEAELAEIDAEKVADEIIERHKETLIGKLVGSAFDDTVELKRFRDALVKAYKAGTREGIAEARAAYKAGQAKVKARRQLRQYVLKLMGRIKRPVGRSAAFPQRLAIKLIQDQMDPKFRRADTIARRRASREYFAQHPESEVPAKALKIIESIAPNELSVLQLEVIAQQVHELKRKGRILAQAAFAARREELAAAKKTVADAISGGTVDVSALEPVVAAPKISMAQKLKDVHRLWLTPERVLDWFDGRKLFHGPILDLFWRRPADAESAKVVRIKAQMDAHRAALAEVGMTAADLHATAMEILGKPITVEEAMTIYNFGRNAYSRLAVTFGNFHGMLTEARWRAINEFVESDPRLQYLADYMIAYYDSHYGRLREAVIVTEDRDPGHQDNYTPMRRMEANYTPDERNLLSEMMQRAHFKRGYEEKGMTLARQDIPEEYQKPIRLDGWQLMLEQAERREHYIAFAGLTKQMRAIGHDEAVVAALIRRHGAEAVKWLQRYTDVVANPYIYRQYNQIERICGAIRRNTAIAFLAWKISTALKQVASLSLYLPEAGHHLLQAGFEAASDWTAVREFVVARDPLIEFATLERELEELKRAKPGEYAALVQRFGKAGLKGLMWFDAPTRTIGWYGVYLHELEAATKAGLDPAAAEARAVAEARMTTSRTQPGARVFQIPEAYRTHEILNLFQQFTNQLNKLWNITSYDLPSLMMNHQYRRAFMTFAALGLQAGLIWTISHRRVPEDEDDLASIAKEGFVGLIPIVGSNYVALDRGFGGDGIAAAEGGAAFALNMQKALGELGTEGRIDLKTLEAAYRGVAPVVGVPYTGPKNLIEFGATGDPYYLLGGRPAGESKNPKRKAAVERRRKP